MIDDGMRGRIAAAIAKAEQGTRAEFVAAIARRADEYRSNALLAALAAAGLSSAAEQGPGEALGLIELADVERVAALPQVRQMRRCSQTSPVLRHSSQPSALGVTVFTSAMCLQGMLRSSVFAVVSP